MKRKFYFKSRYIPAIITSIAVLSGMFWSTGFSISREADAAIKQTETVDLRIIGTTDLHGQVNSKDYEQGVDYNNGGLARVMDLIVKTRDELPRTNTVTLDAGDVLFDYTTEYIFSENQNEIQPIYTAMAMIGYDAITLGNHDFDYGYDYIQRQLNGSGLRDITIVSNVTDSKTGKYPFLENMLITRKMKTSSGSEVEVKVGIIGQTIPTLTSKTHSYAGILKTEDMVLNAQIQATKLKEMGADVVIALSHTGIGPENPELNFKNVAYALTKIPEIDVVVAGHEHNLFPTTDMTSPYYKLPNVDKKTFLMNGKNVIMAGDRGRAIGVVDLTLEVTESSVKISDRKSEIRKVTASNTKENVAIATSYGKWEEELLHYSTDIIGALDKNVVIQNYYGLMGDNTAIQLLNNSKLHYALKFANTTGKEYKNYPIIAASTYTSFGVNSINDFVNIKDQITESDLSTIQPYNNYLYVYTITGKQLKEWLEWSASAYEDVNTKSTWTNQTMQELMKQKGIKSLISEEWLNDWSNFYIFDGIDYVINPAAGPRYDISGNKISNNKRIQSVTYNGKEVTDNMVLLLATNKITKPVGANNGVEKQAVLNGFIRSQAILSKYIEQVAISGDILPQVDNNWKISFPYKKQVLVKAPFNAHELLKNTPWNLEYLLERDQYRYYIANYSEVKDEDTTEPNIIVAPLTTSATASAYNISVAVSDASKLKSIRYMNGDFDADYAGWQIARELEDQVFKVYENGTYTIFAEDIHGNKTVRKLIINNFSDNLLARPTAETYTNRKTKISGTAEPGSTIVFEAYTGTYEMKISKSGKYSYALPAQPSGTEVTVYIKDETKGLESERINIPVKRTGPNQPSINPIHNNSGIISGDTNDNDATVVAVIDDTVYVAKNGGRQLYEKNTEIYDPSLKIFETDIEVLDTGYFTLLLPPQAGGTEVTIYNLDHLSRNSRVNSTKVVTVAPNAPVVYEVSNIEKSLSGYVPASAGKTYNILIDVDGRTYETKTDKYGKFSLSFTNQLHAGLTLYIAAFEEKNGSYRFSYTTEVVVSDIEDHVKTESTNLIFNRVTNKSNFITGYYYDNGTVYLAIAEGEGETFTNTLLTVTTDSSSKFRYALQEKLKEDTVIYAMVRFTDGRIVIANKITVTAGRPDTPSLKQEITNTDKLAQVIAFKDCEVVLNIGSKTYVSKEYQLDELTGQYIYSFVTDRDVSGTEITITATNSSGTSDAYTSKIVQVAPDSPKVNTVKAGDKLVTGKIELLDYVKPDLEDSTTKEKIPSRFKDAPSKVAKTQTRVFAQIGSKTYEGTIDNKGNFKIEIPEQTEETGIKVWGMNKAGRGPLIKVIVAAE